MLMRSIAGLLTSAVLATSDAAWDRIRERMNAKTGGQFAALKAGFRAGIPAEGPINAQAAEKTLRPMAKTGGPHLVGDATDLPEGTFFAPGS
ncbi:MAG: hypothetical protein AAF281_08355 [Pseudomonadota bacterium]